MSVTARLHSDPSSVGCVRKALSKLRSTPDDCLANRRPPCHSMQPGCVSTTIHISGCSMNMKSACPSASSTKHASPRAPQWFASGVSTTITGHPIQAHVAELKQKQDDSSDKFFMTSCRGASLLNTPCQILMPAEDLS